MFFLVTFARYAKTLSAMKENVNKSGFLKAVTLGKTIAALALLGLAAESQAVVINVDLNGRRNSDPYGATYSGVSPAGGGNLFNGIQVDDSSESDMIPVSASSLLDSTGAITLVGFSFSNPVAAGDGNAGSNPTSETALFNDYIFINGGSNTVGSTVITVTGLAGATANLFFYNRPDLAQPLITIPGASATTYADGIYWSANTQAFYNVPIVDGAIAITLGNGNSDSQLLSGFTIDSAVVPEPASIALLGLGIGVIIFRGRQMLSKKCSA